METRKEVTAKLSQATMGELRVGDIVLLDVGLGERVDTFYTILSTEPSRRNPGFVCLTWFWPLTGETRNVELRANQPVSIVYL